MTAFDRPRCTKQLIAVCVQATPPQQGAVASPSLLQACTTLCGDEMALTLLRAFLPNS